MGVLNQQMSGVAASRRRRTGVAGLVLLGGASLIKLRWRLRSLRLKTSRYALARHADVASTTRVACIACACSKTSTLAGAGGGTAGLAFCSLTSACAPAVAGAKRGALEEYKPAALKTNEAKQHFREHR